MKNFLIALAYAALAGAASGFLTKSWIPAGFIMLSFPLGWIGSAASTRPAPRLGNAVSLGMTWTVVYLCAHLIWHIW
jgi:hypothetical protein